MKTLWDPCAINLAEDFRRHSDCIRNSMIPVFWTDHYEIQDKIYFEYLTTTEIKYDAYSEKFSGPPSLAIQRTCHKVVEDSRDVCSKIWPTQLTIQGYNPSIYGGTTTPRGLDANLSFFHGDYIRRHFDSFTFHNIRLNPSWNWNDVLSRFDLLRTVEIKQNHQYIFEAENFTNQGVFDYAAFDHYEHTFRAVEVKCLSSSMLKDVSKLFRQRMKPKADAHYKVRATCEYRVLRERRNNQSLLHTIVQRNFKDGDMHIISRNAVVAGFD